MTANRYTFDRRVPVDELEATLTLAVLAAEALHGPARVRLGAPHALDADARTVVLATRGAPARDLNLVFAGFAEREFGASAFTVTPVA